MTESKKSHDDWLSISEISRKCRVTRQAVYVAIKNGRLKAAQINRIWFAHVDDIEAYRSSRYNREHSRINGEPIFDILSGYLSVNHIAKLFGETPQRIYYLLRTGQVPASKKGAAWVVNIEEMKKVYDQIGEKKRGMRPDHKDQLNFA